LRLHASFRIRVYASFAFGKRGPPTVILRHRCVPFHNGGIHCREVDPLDLFLCEALRSVRSRWYWVRGQRRNGALNAIQCSVKACVHGMRHASAIPQNRIKFEPPQLPHLKINLK
jgi:hypothetical protein